MVTKSWCDGCLKERSNVHLYDGWCLDCGNVETGCLCEDCVSAGRQRQLLGCSRCGRGTVQRFVKSLYTEAEMQEKPSCTTLSNVNQGTSLGAATA